MATMAEAIQALAPGAQFSLFGEDYNSLVWLSPDIPVPTYDQVQDEITVLTLEQPIKDCKYKASKLLYATDWTTIADVADPMKSNPYLINQSAFIVYRSNVRKLAVNPVADPVWPVEPTAQWSA